MTKQHFLFKLVPPRASFGQDMDDRERELMRQHTAYAKEQFDAGLILVYGPVMAPTGAFGIAILQAEHAAEVQQFGENDPSVLAGLNTFEFYPMMVAAARGIQ